MFDESAAEAWTRRYGSAPPDGLPEVSRLLSHRSVRHFEPKELPESTLEALIAAAQSASTSSNLQLWSIIDVRNAQHRDQLATYASNYRHIVDASWFGVFIADHVRLREAASKFGEHALGLDYMEYLIMSTVDAAIAAERMVCAAQQLGLGTCYIGAIRNDVDAVSKMLQLPVGTSPLFGLCIGFPDTKHDASIKPRLTQSCVVFRDQYPEHTSIGDYDDRMRAFYEEQGMKGDVTWSMRSGRRVDESHLGGRAILKDWLQERGFGVR